MTAVVRWEDPPGTNKADKYAVWNDAVAEMKLRPNAWAVIAEKNHVQAQSIATMVRSGYGPFAPKGTFEVKTRAAEDAEGKFTAVYARYVGGAA